MICRADAGRPPFAHAAMAALLTVLALTSAPVLAEWQWIEQDGISLVAGAEVAAGLFNVDRANFGSGRTDLRSGEFARDPFWQEAYAKPSLDFEVTLGSAGALYANATAVASWTGGDGDAGGFTDGGDARVSMEALAAGWRSGGIFAESLGEDALDLSYGRQRLDIGDGFLFADGNLEQFGKGAYWLGPRLAFRRTGVIRVETKPVRADVFHLETDRDYDFAEAVGINVEYLLGETGRLGGMFLQLTDSGPPVFFGARDGMEVWNLRAQEVNVPGLPGVTFWAEYVGEGGAGRDGDFDAEAWFVEGAYAFGAVPWTPTLSYRYAAFSGDPDPNDTTREDFDPLFYGWSRGWGSWNQGEITGQYLLFNSNQRNHLVHVAANPREDLVIGGMFFRFDLDQPDYFGTPVSDEAFVDELNLYADWAATEEITVSAVYGVAIPRQGAEDAFGDDDLTHLVMLFFIASY